MTKCNTDQLLDPELETYLIRRRETVRTLLDQVVRTISTPGNDTQDNRDHRQALLGRITELDTLRQTLEEEETARRQRDLDDFERSLAGEAEEEAQTTARQRNAMKQMIEENEKARTSDYLKLGFKDLQSHASFTPKK